MCKSPAAIGSAGLNRGMRQQARKEQQAARGLRRLNRVQAALPPLMLHCHSHTHFPSSPPSTPAAMSGHMGNLSPQQQQVRGHNQQHRKPRQQQSHAASRHCERACHRTATFHAVSPRNAGGCTRAMSVCCGTRSLLTRCCFGAACPRAGVILLRLCAVRPACSLPLC